MAKTLSFASLHLGVAFSVGWLLTGKWWQLASATVAMAVFVTALSLLADAIRDALDPRLKGR